MQVCAFSFFKSDIKEITNISIHGIQFATHIVNDPGNTAHIRNDQKEASFKPALAASRAYFFIWVHGCHLNDKTPL